MAIRGEEWVKHVLKEQGWSLYNLANENIFATNYNLGLIVEEKDYKFPIKVGKTIYTVAGRKRYPFKFNQIKKQTLEIIDKLRKINRFFNLVQVYVVSRMIGRNVYAIRRYNTTIFIVHKSYFPVWLKSLKLLYLGVGGLIQEDMYMGGK